MTQVGRARAKTNDLCTRRSWYIHIIAAALLATRKVFQQIRHTFQRGSRSLRFTSPWNAVTLWQVYRTSSNVVRPGVVCCTFPDLNPNVSRVAWGQRDLSKPDLSRSASFVISIDAVKSIPVRRVFEYIQKDNSIV